MPNTPSPTAANQNFIPEVASDQGIDCAVRCGRSLANLVLLGISLACLVACGGCGTTKAYEATEQLLLSEAVDDSIAHIDFRPMSGYRVFLDTQYIKNVKSLGFVNSDYIISSLRQQVVGAGCLLQDKLEEADLVIEAGYRNTSLRNV